MKAAQIHSYGGPEVVTVRDDAPTPQLKGGQIMVEVYAASINPADTKMREGAMKDHMHLEDFVTLGGDFAGHVKTLGPSVAGFTVGDEVFGQGSLLVGGSGTFAEKVAVNTSTLAKMPKELTMEQGGALPLAGVSAIQALEEHIQLKQDQKILIHGGSGGIGHLAVQIAKALGAYVITTVSTEHIQFMNELHADEVIDYKAQDFVDVVKDVDAVFDTAGGEVTTKSLQVLKKGGILVAMTGVPSEDEVAKYGVTAIGQFTQVNTARLKRLAWYVGNGLKVVINKTFTLDEVQDAFRFAEEQSVEGKVVVKVK